MFKTQITLDDNTRDVLDSKIESLENTAQKYGNDPSPDHKKELEKARTQLKAYVGRMVTSAYNFERKSPAEASE